MSNGVDVLTASDDIDGGEAIAGLSDRSACVFGYLNSSLSLLVTLILTKRSLTDESLLQIEMQATRVLIITMNDS